MLEFEWASTKDSSNITKHGVSFAEAATVFNDPLELAIADPDHSEGEYRFLSLGRSERDRLLVVAYTERSGKIRIISARAASPKETRQYETT